MAVCAAGKSGVGPGVNRRFLCNIAESFMNWDGYQYTRLGILASVYNPGMALVDQIQKDIVTAMKAKDEARLSTLRMVKSALQLRQIEKMGPLDDKESQ